MGVNQYKKIGEILLKKKWINPAQVEKALAIQRTTGARFGEILIKQKWISTDMLLEALGERFGIPSVKINSYTIDPNVVKIIPMEMALRYKVVPLFIVENVITLAMADPLDIAAMDAVRYHTGKRVQEVVALEEDIDSAIDKFYNMSESINEVASHLEKEKSIELESRSLARETPEQGTTDETSIIRYVNLLFLQAIRDKASDIHLEPTEKVFRVRFRVDGLLREIATPSSNLASMIISRVKVLADLDVSEKRLPQDGGFRLKLENREVDVRVSILPTVYGEKAVLRLLDPSSVLLKLEDLGFSPDVLKSWREIITMPDGLVLITGPTGSGKTTVLYASLNTISSLEKNIITVENPVEYKLPLINQVQVNAHIGMTFGSVLRSILRQDPDIIMVGEIRDNETAEIAIRSALTGHLVFSTLHTNSAAGAITRLTDMGVEPFLVSSAVKAVLAQRLVRRVCPNCKVEDQGGAQLLEKQLQRKLYDGEKIYKGKGCRECKNTGFLGRTGIYELLTMDFDFKQLVMQGASENTLLEHARKNGMRTLREDGFLKVLEGVTSIEEVLRVASR